MLIFWGVKQVGLVGKCELVIGFLMSCGVAKCETCLSIVPAFGGCQEEVYA